MSRKNEVWVWILAPLFGAALSTGCDTSPQAKEAKYLRRGDALLDKKDYPRALLEFRNALKSMPRDAEPYYKIGLAYVGVSDIPHAVWALRRATELNPKHFQAQLKLAGIMAATRDKTLVQEASSRLEAVLANSPDNAEASDTLAVAEWKLGQPEDAARRIEETLRKFPDRLQSSVALARMKLTRKDLAGAEEVLKQAVASAPQSPQAALALGQLYWISQQPDKAEAQMNQVLRLDPKNGPALVGLGAIQVSAHRMDEAERTYQRLAALPDKEFNYLHALFLFQTGQRDAALAEFVKLARADPDDRGARSRLLAAYAAIGKIPEAQTLLAEALKRHPKDADALFQRAELYLKAGNARGAEMDLKEVIDLKPDSAQAHFVLAEVYSVTGSKELRRQELNEAVRLDRNMIAARLALARLFVASNEAKSALDLLDQTPPQQKALLEVVVERNWALLAAGNIKELRSVLDVALKTSTSPDLLVQDAILKMRGSDFVGAQTGADAVLARNPEDVRAARIAADSYVAQKQPQKALARLSELAQSHPKSAPLQDLLGQWYLTHGKLPEARQAFESAKAADPGFVQSDLALASVDQSEHHTDAARQRLIAILATDPKNIPALTMLARIEGDAGNRAESIQRYRAILDIDSTNLFALNNLAYTLALDNPDEALKYAQQAGEIAPDNAFVEDTLGWVYYRKGIYRTAVGYLQKAVAKQPTPRREFHLGMSYLKIGEPDLGRSTVRAALQKDPSLAKTEQGW
jgi:tetratricopeptide (TPR) repeat protein